MAESKLLFDGVNPDLLRATSPFSASNTPPTPVLDSPKERVNGQEGSGVRRLRVTGPSPGSEGVSQGEVDLGKQSCLRSVSQRLRSGLMNPVEEARAMNFLVEQHIVKNQADLAQILEKPKSKISEKLSILKLPRSVQVLIERYPEVITEGHAIELLRLKDEALITGVAKRILEMRLTRDRLRTEIAFLLEKHGGKPVVRVKRGKIAKIRYFPKVDGGFDLIYRFRPDGEIQDLREMIADMEAKLAYLKNQMQRDRRDEDQVRDLRAQKRTEKQTSDEKPPEEKIASLLPELKDESLAGAILSPPA